MKYKLAALFSFILLAAVVFYLFSGQKMLQNTIRIAFQTTTPSPITTQIPTPTVEPANTSSSQGGEPRIPLTLSQGFTIHTFADGLVNPRTLIYTPGGTLLASSPEGNEVYALPDKDSNGAADEKKVIISNENHVHGLAFFQNQLFIADTTKVVRYNWDEKSLTATLDKVLFSLPANSDHNSRSIVFNKEGKMFISLGSTCNVCIESAKIGGSVLVSDKDGSDPQVFATGLRNAAFLAINPSSGELWVTEMGRDKLGDNTPPDEINIVQKDQDYGWPYCYSYKVHDAEFDPLGTHNCDNTQPPLYEIPAHSAPLGLVFINSPQFPSDWQGDLIVAYHGSWDRSTPTGYKLVHLTVNKNKIISSEDFLTGFAPASTPQKPGNNINAAKQRPAGLVFDGKGNLYLSDDKGGNIYIIQKQ